MAFDIAQFRQHFPEFGDTVRYPDPQIEFWSSIGEICLIEDRWKTLYAQGMELFVAHNITMATQNLDVADAGGDPGSAASGPVQSKTVGSVSKSYDSQAIAEQNAGQWNATSYGRTLIRLARMIGVGAHQV